MCAVQGSLSGRGVAASVDMTASILVQQSEGLELLADQGGIGTELLAFAHGEPARSGQVDVDYGRDATGSRAHHGDAVGEKDRLPDAVRDEKHGLAIFQPDPLEVEVHLIACERIKCPERL